MQKQGRAPGVRTHPLVRQLYGSGSPSTGHPPREEGVGETRAVGGSLHAERLTVPRRSKREARSGTRWGCRQERGHFCLLQKCPMTSLHPVPSGVHSPGLTCRYCVFRDRYSLGIKPEGQEDKRGSRKHQLRCPEINSHTNPPTYPLAPQTTLIRRKDSVNVNLASSQLILN